MDNGYVFGLDIGTRSIVGTVGYRVGADRFVVVAQESIEHTTRAVIDGQIHDIATVAKTIIEVKTKLEKRLKLNLHDVSIAAAGRVLKTREVHVIKEFKEDTIVTKDHIKSMDAIGVEKAYDDIRNDVDDKDKKFFCVGYSAARFYLNGYQMEMVEGHKAKSIAIDLIATFLPEEVIEGLYAAVEAADLTVASLTLEPIAAINVAIPEKFRLLNIGLVDIGAGTSDISIVKDGSIIAFGMIPLAGDEVTEAIAKEYLLDFESAEMVKRKTTSKKSVPVKNIFGDTIHATKEDVQEISKRAVADISKQIADKIIKLNGGKSVSAVFVVGGGGRAEGFTDALAKNLGILPERVALRGADVLSHIDFKDSDVIKDSTMVTPIGICLNFYDQTNSFIHVTVNDELVKLYDNGKVTILDAALSAGFSQENLFPARGESLHYTLNGQKRTVRGEVGEVVEVKNNHSDANLNDVISENDVIEISPSTVGKSGSITIGQIDECRGELTVEFMGKTVICPEIIMVNGDPTTSMYEVKEGDEIEVRDYYSVQDMFEFVGMEKSDMVILNGDEVRLNAKIHDKDKVEAMPERALRGVEKEDEESNEPKEESFEEQLAKAPLLKPAKPMPEWMSDVPFDTAKLGSDGSVVPGAMDRIYYQTPAPDKKSYQDQILEKIDKVPDAKDPEPVRLTGVPTHITVNGKEVTIPAKSKGAIFVDVFDVYAFDMSKVGGSRLITRINGVDKNFTDPLSDGDAVELYWEK